MRTSIMDLSDPAHREEAQKTSKPPLYGLVVATPFALMLWGIIALIVWLCLPTH
jgi:hypothetical protein